MLVLSLKWEDVLQDFMVNNWSQHSCPQMPSLLWPSKQEPAVPVSTMIVPLIKWIVMKEFTGEANKLPSCLDLDTFSGWTENSARQRRKWKLTANYFIRATSRWQTVSCPQEADCSSEEQLPWYKWTNSVWLTTVHDPQSHHDRYKKPRKLWKSISFSS